MASYSEPLITADKILDLFTPQRPSGFSHTDILRQLNYAHQTEEAGYVLSALHKLEKDELIELYGHGNNIYKVTGKTFLFKESGKYEKLIERENEIEQAKSVGEQMALRSAQSVIDTNKSIQLLNTKTDTFYTKQTKFNNWQKWLTIAIFLTAAVQAWVATCNYISPTNSGKGTQLDTAIHNKELRQLESRIQSQTNKFETFSKAVKDSLKMK